MRPASIPPGQAPGASGPAPSPAGCGEARLPILAFPEDRDALIHPTREPGEEPVTPTVILTFTQPDYQALCRLAEAKEKPRHLWGCACRTATWQGVDITLVAPALGAPFAAMVTEKVIALGASRVLVLGWCGSLSPQVHIGDVLLPDRIHPGDGTSPHYWGEPGSIPPDPGLYNHLSLSLKKAGIPWHTGPVWSTDAFYRETPGLIQSCQHQGILGIDLEMAALFAVGRFRGIAVAGVLVVSDELFSLTWQPAKGSPPFRAARQAAFGVVLDVAASI